MNEKIIYNYEVLEKDKKRFKYLMILLILICGIFIVNIFSKSNINTPGLKLSIYFIKTFNSLLAFFAFGTCLISYRRIKRDDIFVISIMYLSFAVGILLGQIDCLNFYYEKYRLSNYLTIGPSLLRITLLLTALCPDNVFNKYMVKYKIKSMIFVIAYTTIIGSIERILMIDSKDYSTEFFVVYNGMLTVIYMSASYTLFTTGKKEKEYIYYVLGISILMLSLKAIYAIFVSKYISFDVKLTSVAITYITLLTVIAGTFLELYIYISKTKMLNENLKLFFNLVENNKHSMMLIYDEKKEIAYANEKLRRFSYIDDENYKEKLKSIYDKNMIIQSRKKEIMDSLDENGTWRGMIKDEINNIYVDSYSQVISKKGDVAFTCIDISEEIKKEIELEKLKVYNDERTEFMSNISHELRTPVNIFYSTLQLLDRFSDKENFDFKFLYNRYSKTLHVNCKRMLRLINNVVDISKIESGILKGKFDYYNIVSIVEDVSLSVVNYAEVKSINIIFDTNTEENIIYCDPALIEKVMLNLLSNAIKFTHDNKNIYVNVLVNEDFTEIDVKDEGIGISKKDKDAIFERFMQADKSLTRENEGSGIGLSIVKSIIDLHDGYISVDSEIGKGSTFKIIIPNKSGETEECKIYDINNYTTELELSDIYDILT